MRILRRLTEDDLRQAVALKVACWPEELAGVVEDFLDFDDEFTFWRDWMHQGEAFEDVRLLVGLFEDDLLLGAAFASIAEKIDVESGGIELNGLWVSPKFRGEGISLQLLKHVVGFYRGLEKGYCQMVIYNHHFAPSNSYYVKLGAELLRGVFQMDGRLKVDVFLLDFEKIELAEGKFPIYLIHGAGSLDLDVVQKALSDHNDLNAGSHLSKPLRITYKRDGVVCGGCTGGIAWGWLFIDNLFVEAPYRNQGIGDELLERAIHFARGHQIDRISVSTIYDEAAAFFHKRGFVTDGVLNDRPKGFCFRFMHKVLTDKVSMAEAKTDVADVSEGDLDVFFEKVEADKLKNVGDVPFEFIGLALKDCQGTCVGGLIGYVGWHWLYVSVLWTSSSVRGQGFGKRMVSYVERYAKSKGVQWSFLGTTDFQAPDFYKQMGYEVFSVREDLPPGHVNYSMMKRI